MIFIVAKQSCVCISPLLMNILQRWHFIGVATQSQSQCVLRSLRVANIYLLLQPSAVHLKIGFDRKKSSFSPYRKILDGSPSYLHCVRLMSYRKCFSMPFGLLMKSLLHARQLTYPDSLSLMIQSAQKAALQSFSRHYFGSFKNSLQILQMKRGSIGLTACSFFSLLNFQRFSVQFSQISWTLSQSHSNL